MFIENMAYVVLGPTLGHSDTRTLGHSDNGYLICGRHENGGSPPGDVRTKPRANSILCRVSRMQLLLKDVTSEVFTAVTMKNILWDIRS
jgi:hypothetical protein